MVFGVNYSPVLVRLAQAGAVRVDTYKCPAWPELLRDLVSQSLPLYVHFGLGIGHGQGMPYDSETRQPANLDRLDEILQLTGTPLVNTHFVASQKYYPDIPLDSLRPEHIRRVIDGALRDLEPLIQRFGAEKVTIENLINEYGWLDLAAMPEVITRLVEESGCGFLFDLSHARITADNLGLDPRGYIRSLPVDQMREMHVTGLQVLEGDLLEMMLRIGDPYGMAKHTAGKRIDHLPMMQADWPELAWALEQVRSDAWRVPWVVAFECGGIGPFWEEISTEAMYLEQLPRMAVMIRDYELPDR